MVFNIKQRNIPFSPSTDLVLIQESGVSRGNVRTFGVMLGVSTATILRGSSLI